MIKRKLPKIIYFLFCFLLIFEQSGFAQISGELNISGYFGGLRNALIQDKFRPLHLRYLAYDNLSNNFSFLVDKGDLNLPQNQELKNSTKELLNYFFVGISLPNDSFWVNLRPDAADNIIDSYLAQTDLGKVLLEADLQLKKDTANFTSPQTPEGKDYWKKLYQKANELFGGEKITIPTLTRPWIVPGEIIIRQTQENAYVYKATLKVMLEQDYLKESPAYNFSDERLKQLNEYASELMRKTIIPKLTQDVNTAKRYAPLRQVYYSLILAQWFKQKFSGKNGLYSQLINQKNLHGLTSQEAWSKDTYFQAYQKSFREGEYNIKESVYTLGGQTVRNYMSGGISFGGEFIAEAVKSGGEITGSLFRPMETLNLNGVFLGKLSGGTFQDPYSGEIEINLENTISISSPVRNQTVSTLLKEKYLRSSIFPKGLSQQEKEEWFESGLRIMPSKENSRGYRLSRNSYFPIFNTPLSKIDEEFLEILQEPLSEKIVRLAKEKQGQHLYILSWGAGNLKSDVELTSKLKGNKFKIYAFGNTIGENMSDFAENNVVPIFDIAENLIQDIPAGQKMDAIYSYAGIHFLLNALQVNTNEAAFLEYLNNLTKILSAEGFIVFNTLSEVKFEKLKRLLPELKKTFKEVRLIWSKENKDGYIFLQGLKNKSVSSPVDQSETLFDVSLASVKMINVRYQTNSPYLDRYDIIDSQTKQVVGWAEFYASGADTLVLRNIEIEAKGDGYGTALVRYLAENAARSGLTFQMVGVYNPVAWVIAQKVLDQETMEVYSSERRPEVFVNQWIPYHQFDDFNRVVNGPKIIVAGREQYLHPFNLKGKLKEIKSVSSPIKQEVNEIVREAVVLFNANIPSQCVDATLFIAGRLEQLGVFHKILTLNIPHDASKIVEIGDATDSHTMLEAVFDNKVWVIDTQLKQFTLTDRNKLTLPEEFVSRYIYQASEYYSTVPVFSDSICAERVVSAALSPNQLASSPVVDTQMIEALRSMEGLEINKDGETYKFEVQKKDNDNWDRVVVLKDKQGEEIGFFELSTKSIGYFNARFIRITNPVYLTRGFAKLILEEVEKVFPKGKTITTEIASQESLKELEEGKSFASIGIVRLFESAGWEFTEGGYYAGNGEYHQEPFGEIMGEDMRKGEEGRVVATFKAKGIQPHLSSLPIAADAKGGIDLRALPIVSQPALNMPVGNIPTLRPLVNINLDESWSQIQSMLKVGIIPSSERIKEYLQSCCGKENMGQEIDRILVCIADIFRLQEEQAISTDASLKEMLALLESDKSVDEMQFALAEILVSEKELLTIEK